MSYKASPEEVDMEAAEKTIRRAGSISFLAFIAAAFAGYYLLPMVVDFPIELAERIAFAIKASLFIWLWVLIAVGLVSTGRRTSPQDIGGSAAGPPSDKIAIYVAFLQNTLEQAALATATYLGLAVLVDGDLLALIVVALLFFTVGRILFLKGYSRGAQGRALGMTLTMTPTVLGLIWALGLVIYGWFPL
jgi:hypothetical protein